MIVYIYIYIYGSSSTLFLSGSLKSGPTSTSSNFPLVLLLISTTRHMWDVTAVDSQDQHALLLPAYMCVCGSMCGVKGAIHEQLAGVKSGKGMEPCCLWRRVYLCVCERKCVCACACVPICLSLCGSTWHWCGHNKVSVWLLPVRPNCPWGRPFGCGQVTQAVVITGRAARRLYADSNGSNNTG